MQIGVNHFGHFLLTNLLLPMIKVRFFSCWIFHHDYEGSGNLQTSQPSRIVNVSSLMHRYGKIKKDDLNSEKSYNKVSCYAQSKLANVLFTRELAGRLKGTRVTVNSCHPGVINTELARHLGKITILFSNFLIKPFMMMFYKTPKAGAQTTIYLGKLKSPPSQWDNTISSLSDLQLLIPISRTWAESILREYHFVSLLLCWFITRCH